MHEHQRRLKLKSVLVTLTLAFAVSHAQYVSVIISAQAHTQIQTLSKASITPLSQLSLSLQHLIRRKPSGEELIRTNL